jgi:hypothetical protein
MTFTISSAFLAREHAVDGLYSPLLRAMLIAVLILKPTPPSACTGIRMALSSTLPGACSLE